jgi:hypothetical protein
MVGRTSLSTGRDCVHNDPSQRTCRPATVHPRIHGRRGDSDHPPGGRLAACRATPCRPVPARARHQSRGGPGHGVAAGVRPGGLATIHDSCAAARRRGRQPRPGHCGGAPTATAALRSGTRRGGATLAGPPRGAGGPHLVGLVVQSDDPGRASLAEVHGQLASQCGPAEEPTTTPRSRLRLTGHRRKSFEGRCRPG